MDTTNAIDRSDPSSDPQDSSTSSTPTHNAPTDAWLSTPSDALLRDTLLDPHPDAAPRGARLVLRYLILSCTTPRDAPRWTRLLPAYSTKDQWLKADPRLNNQRFLALSPTWRPETTQQTPFERRQTRLEMDVLIARARGLSLRDLLRLYRDRFPTLRSHEEGTWYDRDGQVVFTQSRSLTGEGLPPNTPPNDPTPAWSTIKHTPSGPVSCLRPAPAPPHGWTLHEVTYQAPFDRCDRERDYTEAWRALDALGRGEVIPPPIPHPPQPTTHTPIPHNPHTPPIITPQHVLEANHQRGASVWEGREDTADAARRAFLARPIAPIAPGLLIRTLDREGIETIGDLLAQSPRVFSSWYAVGRGKQQALATLQETLHGAMTSLGLEHRGGPTTPPPLDDATRALPLKTFMGVPSLLFKTLTRLEITTVGDLLDLNIDALHDVQGIGARRIRALDTLKEGARLRLSSGTSGDLADAWLARLRQQGVDVNDPWQRWLRRLSMRERNALIQAQIHTLKDALILTVRDAKRLRGLKNVGDTSIERLLEAFEAIAIRGVSRYLYGQPSAPQDLTEMMTCALNTLEPDDRALLAGRLNEGQTLQELGEPRGVTRERIRQRLKATEDTLTTLFSPLAVQLCAPFIETLNAQGGVMSEADVTRESGLDTLRDAVFALGLAQQDHLRIWRRRWLLSVDDETLNARDEALSASLNALEQTRLDWPEMEAHATAAGITLPRATLSRWLRERFGFTSNTQGVTISTGRGERLSELLFEARGPMTTEALIEAYAARFPCSKVSRHLDHAAEGKAKASAIIRTSLTRSDEVWTLERGVYCHCTALPFDPVVAEAWARRAVTHLEGETDLVSVVTLRETLGSVPNMSDHSLRHALSQRPEVLTFTSSMNVAHSSAFAQHGLTMTDRVVQFLREAARALTRSDVDDAMPDALTYHEAFLGLTLNNHPDLLQTSRGHYLHIAHVGLSEPEIERLMAAASAALPAGTSIAGRRLLKEVYRRDEGAPRISPPPDVTPSEAFLGLIRRDDRFVCGRSGLVASPGAVGDRLLEQALREAFDGHPERSPAQLRAYVTEEFGLRRPAATLYAALKRMVARGSVTQQGEGRYALHGSGE